MRGGAPSNWNSPADGSLGGLSRLHARKRRRRRTRRLLGALTIFVALCLVLAGGVYGYLRYRNGQITRVAVSHLVTDPVSQPLNILLVGDNARCGIGETKAEQQHWGSCSQVGGGRSDVTMVLHLNPKNHSVWLLSIPRDTFIPIPNTNKENRVDAAFDFGPSRLVATIEDDFGIPINDYIELNFVTFENVVNALGGVNMYFPTALKDHYSGLNVPTPGCHHLTGAQALELVRARHLYYKGKNGQWQYDPTGDLGRIKRDHKFLRVLAAEVKQKGLSNPLTANAVAGSIFPSLTVNKGLGLHELVQLALEFHSVNPNSVPAHFLPVVNYAVPYYYRGANYGDVVFPSEPADQGYLDAFLGRSTEPGSSLSPSAIRVSVLNGTGRAGQATQTAAKLRQIGFDVVGQGTAKPVGTPSEAVVYYKKGTQVEAQAVLDHLEGEAIMGLDPAMVPAGADVALVTGTDFLVKTSLALQALQSVPTTGSSSSSSSSTGPSSSSAGPTTTSPSGSSVNSSHSGLPQVLTDPSWLHQPNSLVYTESSLPNPWWDPTACPPGAKPTPVN